MKSLACYVAAAVLVLPAIPASATTLSGAAFFRGDATGNNLYGQNGILYWGGWTTVLNQQNIPGNYGYSFFLATTPNPAPASFLSPSAALSIPLNAGANTFYFWADKDDMSGGSDTFGLNFFFNNAGPLNASVSSYVVPGVGQTFQANSSPQTSGLNFQYIPGTGALSFVDGTELITLTGFEVTGVGGSPAGPNSVDLVNSDNTMPFTPPPHPNGVTDTYGWFTLTVTPVPEPGTLALLAFGALGVFVKGRRRVLK